MPSVSSNYPSVWGQIGKIAIRLFIGFVLLLSLLLAAIWFMAGSDRGTQYLLENVIDRQKIIKYQYVDGNFRDGLRLDQVQLMVKQIEVKIDSANLALGWRAILNKEMHFRRAKLTNLVVINHKVPTGQPFPFKPIKLPFDLRLDNAEIDQLTIVQKVKGIEIPLTNIELNDASWIEHQLQLEDSKLSIKNVDFEHINGEMNFQQKYPINMTADIKLAALKKLQADQISLVAKGSLDRLVVGAATKTPDLVRAYAVLHPVEKNVPLSGRVYWEQYKVPFAKQEKIELDQGFVDVSGTIKQLKLHVDSRLKSKRLPQTDLVADLTTNLKLLQINQLQANLMAGQITAQGGLAWKDGVAWDLKGQLVNLNKKHPSIPQQLVQYLPEKTDGSWFSRGGLKPKFVVDSGVKFNQAETWRVQLSQVNHVNNTTKKSTKLWLINGNWQGLNRTLPYVKMLNSPQGQFKVIQQPALTLIDLSAEVDAAEKALLPVGRYSAKLMLNKQHLIVQRLLLTQPTNGRLNAKAKLWLPQANKPMQWHALVDFAQFNPQQVHEKSPLQRLSGRINGYGYAKTNQQMIHIRNVNLKGLLDPAIGVSDRDVMLSGAGQMALLFHDAKKTKQTGLRGYGVNFDGRLLAANAPDGTLKLQLSGTPKMIKLNRLYHNGVAGKADIAGTVDLNRGVRWQLKAILNQFKPHYFIKQGQGNLSGVIVSNGEWSTTKRLINIPTLNLAGKLNAQPIVAKGSLLVALDPKQKGFVPTQLQAKDLKVNFSGNHFIANGNQRNMRVQVDARHLYQLHPKLKGQIIGAINVAQQPAPRPISAKANLIASNIQFGSFFTLQEATIRGSLPSMTNGTTQMQIDVTNFKSRTREISDARAHLVGNYKAHVLNLTASNSLSQFQVQLLGGFNSAGDWLGQIREGKLDSKRIVMQQDKFAGLIFRRKNNSLFIDQHCWRSESSRLCLEKPMTVNRQNGLVLVRAENISLNDFKAFTPQGLELTGRIDGFSLVSWKNGGPLSINASLVTKDGKVGLASDDPDYPPMTMDYDNIGISVRSVTDGIRVRMEMKTPAMGIGYAQLVIDPSSANKNIRGEVALDKLQLAVFKPFFPEISTLDGNLSLAGKIGGNIRQPMFNGDFRLKNGRLKLAQLPVNIHNINVTSQIRGDNAKIQGVFNSGKGVGKLSGDVQWRNNPNIRLKLTGQDLFIRQAPLITALVSPDIELNVVPLQRRMTLNGKILVPRAIAALPESNDKGISPSSDVRIVHTDQIFDPETVKRAKPWRIHSDLTVSLGKRVVFEGFGSTIPLAGQLNLTQRGTEGAMRATGAIGVTRPVTIEAYGQRLDLNRAIARFNGRLQNPNLDIDATKNIRNNHVGIKVVGTGLSPNIQVYNDAGLSEQEALNALLTGRISDNNSGVSNTAGFKSDVSNTIAAAGISLGLGSTRQLTNQIGRTFGLSGLALDAEGVGDDTQVSLTGYITPDLYLRYGVGVFTPVNKLTLRYQMNSRLYLEATSSVERAIDLFYHWRW